MKKETITATVIGIVLGAAVALILIFQGKQSQLENNKTIFSSSKITPIVSTLRVGTQTFVIEKPQDGAIVEEGSIMLEGKAPKDSLIVVQSPIKEVVMKNTKEQFSIKFPLAYGENVIDVAFYPKDPQMRVQEKQLRVYYLDNQL